MALNIKDEAVHALAKEIAQLTGESLTEVVRQALIVRKQALSKSQLHEQAREYAAEFARLARESGVDFRQVERDLYDEWGLPK
ncbi:type II toxin-antitoxin system VapB family antitoxin [Aphanothece stagnina]|uniref:type II toxin-antitoxin system VapB family antitoxin n=1 Tax=Aphanothece stagnina TaxID=1004305 RepID=UPI00398E7DAC